MIKLAKYWTPAIVWAGIIFLLSSSQGAGEEFPIPDYVLHAFVFGVLALLLYRALVNSGLSKKASGIVAMLGSFVYGISDELHQVFVPGRDPTINDVVFDTIGAVFAVLIIWILLPKAPKRLKHLGRRLGLD